MNPVSFSEQTIIDGEPLVIGKPLGWTDEQCGGLPAWMGNVPIDKEGNATQTFISCHEATEEERAEFARTGKIWLMVTAGNHPPVKLIAFNPFYQVEQPAQ